VDVVAAGGVQPVVRIVGAEFHGARRAGPRGRAVAGPEDVLLRVVAADAADLHRVLLALKRAGARRVRTMLRLQAIKPTSPVPLPAARP
jgi:hypothetical protein